MNELPVIPNSHRRITFYYLMIYCNFAWIIESHQINLIIALSILFLLCIFGNGFKKKINYTKLCWLVIPIYVVLNSVITHAHIGPSISFMFSFIIIIFFFSDFIKQNIMEVCVFQRRLAFIISISIFIEKIIPIFFVNGLYKLYDYILHNYSVLKLYFDCKRYLGIGFEPAVTAGWLSIGIGACIFDWKLLSEEKRMKRFIELCMFFLGIIFTGKRAYLLFTMATLCILYILYFIKKINNEVRIFILLSLSFFLIVFGNYFFSHINLLGISSLGTDSSSLYRRWLWRSAIETFKNNPVFGIGFFNFQYKVSKGLDVHNVFYQVLAELGIVGALIIFLPLLLKTKKIVLKSITECNILLKTNLIFSVYVLLLNTFMFLTSNVLFYPGTYMLYYLILLASV